LSNFDMEVSFNEIVKKFSTLLHGGR
jgi:hypothetical protein